MIFVASGKYFIAEMSIGHLVSTGVKHLNPILSIFGSVRCGNAFYVLLILNIINLIHSILEMFWSRSFCVTGKL